MTDKTGRCLCGAVSFTARDVQPEFGACHCSMCQRWAGSALLAVTVPRGNISFTGKDAIATIQSSEWAERAWCSKCGTGLWYRVTANGENWDEYEIPIGLFDDQNGLKMTREIFIDKKSPAFSFAGQREQLSEAEVFALYGVTPTGA